MCPSPLVCSPATDTCEASAVDGIDASVDANGALWSYRVPITFTAAADATNAVTLIILDDTFTYANAAGDGSDLRVGDGDPANGFEVPHWIEHWDPDGNSYVWARVPSVTMGTNTIYAYYGNTTVAATGDFDAVFPDAFRSTGDAAIGGTLAHDAFIVELGHTLSVTAAAPLDVTAAYIRIGGTLDADDAGHPGEMGPGAGGASTVSGGGGGGHGGVGGVGGRDGTDLGGAAGPANGAASGETVDMGSGGGTTNSVLVGARGGGAVKLRGQRVIVSGTIDANGEAGVGGTRSSGGAAGGGVLVQATSVSFTGSIAAAGGNGGNMVAAGNDGGGGGGGGRVKLFSRGDLLNTGTTAVGGGAGGTGGDAAPGQAGATGTVFAGTSTVAPALPMIGTEEPL